VTSEGPCVIMAAPGMLQSGPSREIFEAWAEDIRNGVIMTGYSVKGTLGDILKKEPETVQLPDKLLRVRCSFDIISFSAHSDFNQTWSFIEQLKTPNVILVHGERGEMMRLKDKLMELRPSLMVFTPDILQSVRLNFPPSRHAIAVGQLAKELSCIESAHSIHAETPLDSLEETAAVQNSPKLVKVASDESRLSGVLYFKPSKTPLLIHYNDITEFTGFQVATLNQTLRISIPTTLAAVRTAVSHVFEDIATVSDWSFVVGHRVSVSLDHDLNHLVLEWKSSPASDLIADSVSFLVLELSRAPTPGQALYLSNTAPTPEEGVDDVYVVVMSYLRENFAPIIVSTVAEMDIVDPQDAVAERLGKDYQSSDRIIRFEASDSTGGEKFRVTVNFERRDVVCENASVTARIQSILQKLERALVPIPHFYTSTSHIS